TSGSTGNPKGVGNAHHALANRLLWMQEEYHLGPGEGVLHKTPFGFDVSVWELFWPLITGARLVLAAPEAHKDAPHIASLIRRTEVTTLHFVPSMLHAFLAVPGIDTLDSLRRVIASGEALSRDLVQRFYARIPATLHNLYGPTEAAIDVTHHACAASDERPLVPIGRPIANLRLYVLDPMLDPVPAGLPGHLHIGGVGVARGYERRRDLTAECFVPDPFAPGPGARMYRTGDLARWLPDGSIEYLGRLDHQIKIRGVRVEPG
ncbi:AMP-binding protein, partial [Mesorhizobium mediterraneum]|uniref:AMP-binding protein n=1 Tax=Mesorhizobium mediterraneum TaxID=43617 RepID=UPI001783248F